MGAPPPRVLLLLAHPDDEVVGMGSLLWRAPDPWVAHVTDGAPRNLRDAHAHGFASREAYGRARRVELDGALDLAGVAPERRLSLGRVDQECVLDLGALATDVGALLDRVRPDIVLTHPYEGGHPDHDAVAFAAAAAVERAAFPAPDLAEAAFYHAGPSGELCTGSFLHPRPDEIGLHLQIGERSRKNALLACYPTQRATLEVVSGNVERYRPAPRYDFTRAPHAGRLWYERFDWGVDGARFRAMARLALASSSALERAA